MRKTVVLALCILLVGCARSPFLGEGAPTVTRPFESKAGVIWEEKEYDAFIVKRGDGSLSITLVSDDLCQPVEVTSTSGAASVKSGELELMLDTRDLPPGGVAASVQRALMLLETVRFEQNGEELVLSTGKIKLAVEPSKRAFRRLEMERGSVDFFDFTFLD